MASTVSAKRSRGLGALSLIGGLCLLGGCDRSTEVTQAESSAAEGAEPTARTGSHNTEKGGVEGASRRPARKQYGQKIRSSREVALSEILKNPDRFANELVTVQGNVRRACTKKGCWMELAPSREPRAPRCRVTFKDYGFFVPTDSAGARARVHGKVNVSTVDPERVEHWEAEGATFAQKASDGSAREVTLVATGVELWR